VAVLRLSCRPAGSGYVVNVALEGSGGRRQAKARLDASLTPRDREELRWYLEDYLQYPADPAPQIARRVETRLAELGEELFTQIFGTGEAAQLWRMVDSLADTRVEVDAGVEGDAAVPWELLRDPATDEVISVRAGAFVRTNVQAAASAYVPEAVGTLRVLLVICRPGGAADVPFRSVASHLVRLSRDARQAFQFDVLRPPTFAQLAVVLQTARDRGEPYHVVHFDGHGVYLDPAEIPADSRPRSGPARYTQLSPSRPGRHGYLIFEDPSTISNQQLVDGSALGALLATSNVPALVLTSGRSAHADLITEPEVGPGEMDAHQRVQAYGSLAQEVMDAGVAGVVAMGYNVYVVTAAQFIGNVYASLLDGRQLGQAVTAARRQLAASPLRQVGPQPRPLQDWLVPVVFEAAPLTLRAAPPVQELVIGLSQAEAGRERANMDPAMPAGPDSGFYGRDETLLALDRTFDTSRIVLLHAGAGGGKTATAAEFARWYALTGAAQDILFTSFTRHLPLPRLLDQVGDHYGPALTRAGLDWATLDDAQRREVALQVLTQVRLLWIWDNVEPVAGFPAGTPSTWTPAEQHELAQFLRDLSRTGTGCKVLLTSRRDERAWLGDLPARIVLPPMPMLERLELARAVAGRQADDQGFLDVQDWRPLLEFTQGNPLTVTVLARQAIRDHHTTRDQIQAFVDQLRAGAAQVTDDGTQGRGASLAASLDYGFTHAFTENERAQLALLALFQGFIDVDALRFMARPDIEGGPMPTLAGLDRNGGIELLDRAAETGLLTARGSGYYAVHPAIPWHLRRLFERHYGPPESPPARHALHAWTAAIRTLGDYWHQQYEQGRTTIIDVLWAEEDNLLRARQLGRHNGWWNLVIGHMQGLSVLYEHTGRTGEWRRLVDELTPDLTDPATSGPLPEREDEWAILTSYRVRIARNDRDWPEAQHLQQTLLTWHRQQAADLLTLPTETLSASQRNTIRNLAVVIELLGHLLREQDQPACADRYLEAKELFQWIGARRDEGVIAFNLGHAYKSVPVLRDLDQAEHWYQRSLELLDDHDTLGRAQAISQLGMVARQRFLDVRDADAPDEDLIRHLENAAAAFHQVLELLPPDAVGEQAVAHNALANVYADAGDSGRAVAHYQEAIQYQERQDNRYGAGVARYNCAITLAEAGRGREALLYALAALRDFEEVGPGAAPDESSARRLIADIEHPREEQQPRKVLQLSRAPGTLVGSAHAGSLTQEVERRVIISSGETPQRDLAHERESSPVPLEETIIAPAVQLQPAGVGAEQRVSGGGTGPSLGESVGLGGDSGNSYERPVLVSRAVRRRVLADLRLGSRVAEDEDELASYFVETSQWKRVWRGEIDLIYGQKGSGKSAIYATLLARKGQLVQRSVLEAAAEDPREAPAFEDLAADPPASEQQFVALWKLYFLALIADVFENHQVRSAEALEVIRILDDAKLRPAGKRSLRQHMRAAREYVRRLAHPTKITPSVNIDPATGMVTGISTTITFEPDSSATAPAKAIHVEEIFKLADKAMSDKGVETWILIDRLDVVFAENNDLERNALRALFKVYRDLRRFSRIRFKIFLRTDIWLSITRGGFREASHITRDTRLKWTRPALLQLIVRRLLHNAELVELFGISASEELLSDAEAQRRIFDSVFPPQVVSDGKRVQTLEWCLERVSDGSGFCAPRELIHLLSEALEIQVSRLEAGERDIADGTLVDQTCLWQALEQVSHDRLTKTLYAEYPNERPYVEALESSKYQHDIASLCSRWNQPPERTREIAARLAEIGFFERARPGAEEFYISLVYRPELRIIQD
jgi:tetratricopeptide (TPR) repeat protein